MQKKTNSPMRERVVVVGRSGSRQRPARPIESSYLNKQELGHDSCRDRSALGPSIYAKGVKRICFNRCLQNGSHARPRWSCIDDKPSLVGIQSVIGSHFFCIKQMPEIAPQFWVTIEKDAKTGVLSGLSNPLGLLQGLGSPQDLGHWCAKHAIVCLPVAHLVMGVWQADG